MKVGKENILYLKRKWYLAAFLNLLVLPGSGSFVLGRRVDGFIQLVLSFVAMGLLTVCLKSIFGWLWGEFARFNQNYDPLGWSEGDTYYRGSAPKPLFFMNYIAHSLENGSYPMTFGLPTFIFFLLPLFIFFLVWVFALISLLKERKRFCGTH
jgi:TM2 domain-containing membrane protein YozV